MIGNWVRGNITCVYSMLQVGQTDVNITGDMWLDSPTSPINVACLLDGLATSNVGTPGYNGTPSHLYLKLNCYRTKQAADAGRTWASIYSIKGAMIPNTFTFKSDYAEALSVWGPYGSALNMVTIPAIECTNFRALGAPLGGTSDSPSADVVYTPTWPALLISPTVPQMVVTLSDTLPGSPPHQYFYDDGFKVVFYHNGTDGQTIIFPVGGAWLALKRPRALYNHGDKFTLRYDGLINKFVEDDFEGLESVPIKLTYASTITPNLGYGCDYELILTGNAILANPSNATPGQKGAFRIMQDGTGSRTLSYGSLFKFAAGTPVLRTAANAFNVIEYTVGIDGFIYCIVS